MRATIAEISLYNLRHNLKEIRHSISHCKVMPVVKANAYGHGMVECAKVLEQEKVEMLGVAFIEEAISLRKAGISIPILVLTPPFLEDMLDFLQWDVDCIIDSIEALKQFSCKLETDENLVGLLKAHLCIDTGMNREGINVSRLEEFIQERTLHSSINLRGICTHFATSGADEEKERQLFHKQNEQFYECYHRLKRCGFDFRYVHFANSGAIREMPKKMLEISTTVRAGIALYGHGKKKQNQTTWNLRPVLRLKSKVSTTRTIQAGESVGYSRKFIAQQPTTVVTIPIGYGDGYSRLLSGHLKKGKCLIKGKMFSIIGAICMDELMVDIGYSNFAETIQVGEEVVFIGSQGDMEISIEQIAESIQTIPYEITTSITERVPRVYKNTRC